MSHSSSPQPGQEESNASVQGAPQEHASHEHVAVSPPGVNPMMQDFMTFLQTMMRQQSVPPTQPQPVQTVLDPNYERVRAQGARVFTGTTDPTVADEWLRHTERILSRFDCSTEQKVRYATSLFEKDALDWWETILNSRDQSAQPTWNDFIRVFNDKYTPPLYRDRKKVEFLNLVQGDMSVADYEVQFLRLARYAPDEIATDELKRKRFERGLKLEIRGKLIVEPSSYQKLMEMALRAEGILNEEKEEQLKKRKVIGSSSSGVSIRSGNPSFRQGTGGSSSSFTSRRPSITGRGTGRSYGRATGSRFQDSRGPPLCPQCGRTHFGECWGARNDACFICGQQGHYARSCPSRRGGGSSGQSSVGGNTAQISGGRGRGRGSYGKGKTVVQAGAVEPAQSQARVYAVTRQEAPSNPDVITGEEKNEESKP